MPRILFILLSSVGLSCGGQFGFDTDSAGGSPTGFAPALSGQGAPGAWVVRSESSAPSAPMVLTQTNSDATSFRFPLCVLASAHVMNPELSVRFRALAGKKDQAAGLIWRYRDTNNYYVVRANALEHNIVLYKMENGKRLDLKPVGAEASAYGRKVQVPSGEWHTLGVKVRGHVFEVLFNSKPLFVVEDTTFQEAGAVGLWTKADSLVEFDDFKVEEQGKNHSEAKPHQSSR